MVKVIFIIFTLFASSFSVILDCEFSFEWWPKVESKYSCVTTLSEVSTIQRVTGVNGNHKIDKNNSEVESIEFQDCIGSTYIPQNMLNFFPNLIGIRLISCGILILGGNELHEYQNLQLFAVESTQLERIPGNFFASTPQISVIGFADSNLKYVGSKLLQSLNNLSWVSFYNNDCINQTATSLNEIPSLITNLATNCIDIFEESTTTTSTTISNSESTSDETTMQGNTEETTTNGCNYNARYLWIAIVSLIKIM